MIDPDKIADLAAAAERLLGFVDALVPTLHDGQLASLSPAARHQRASLIAAGIDLEAAARHLREASAPPPLPAGAALEEAA